MKSVRISGALKTLLCYLLAWGIAAALPYLGLRFLYPLKLAGTAPQLLPSTLLPEFVPKWLGASHATQEGQWLGFALCCLAVAWLVSLLTQVVWRSCYRRPKQIAKATAGAIHGYRLMLLLLLLWNAAIGLWIWIVGARFIAGFGLWDALTYFGPLPLNLMAAALCSRLAAPAAISGRHAFFKRL